MIRAMAWLLAGGMVAGAHDLHLTYGNLAVEGSVVVYQVRFFQDDLSAALAGHAGEDYLELAAGPELDAVMQDYLRAHFRIRSGGQALDPVILGSGEDELDREPVWWYRVRYDAPAEVRDLEITNTLLFELFHDQRNLMKVVHFPSEDQRTYYFARGEESVRIDFPLR